MKHIAQVFPLKDRMALVAASMVDDDAPRTKAIDMEAMKLKLLYPNLFWNEAETEQMQALWDIQRRERKINAKDQPSSLTPDVHRR
jgi:hypothetical protein